MRRHGGEETSERRPRPRPGSPRSLSHRLPWDVGQHHVLEARPRGRDRAGQLPRALPNPQSRPRWVSRRGLLRPHSVQPQTSLGQAPRTQVPCRQVVPAPELTSRRGMKPLSSCTQGHGACPQMWLPGPRGDTSSWARQGWVLRRGLDHFPSWGPWARHSPLCAPFPRGVVAGEPREAHGHRSAQSCARGKAPR